MSEEQKVPEQSTEKISEPSGPVNIDDLEVQILILAQKAQAMNQTGSFLSRRGWPTTVISNIAEAIKIIVKDRPDFVLISMNHPSPKALKLPALLTKTLNIQCVGFAEKADAITLERLNRSQFTHRIGGFASGPSVQRAIRKILNDIYNPSETSDGSDKKAPEGQGSDAIRISGSDEATVLSGGGDNLHTIKGGSVGVDHDTVESGKYTLHSQKVKRKLKDLTAPKGSASQDQSAQAQELLKLLGEEESLILHPSDSKNKQNSQPPQRSDEGSAATLIINSQTQPLTESENLLSQIVQEALDRVCDQQQSASIEGDLRDIDSVGVLAVDGLGMQGYLLVAKSAKPHEVPTEFLEELRVAMIQDLLAKDLVADISAAFCLKAGSLDFKQWMHTKSPFSLSSQLHNNLILVGFIPRLRPLPQLRNGPDRSMASFPLDTLSPEQAIDFKAYLHLKKNDKYFLYLKEGRHIQSRQLQTLAQRKIKNLAIHNDDSDKLRQYVAKADLKAQSQDFQKKSAVEQGKNKKSA